MTQFETYTLQTVPEEGRPILEKVDKAYGFVPNLMGKMIEAPALAKAYLDIGETFSETSLSPVEQQVVLLTVSRHNKCEYCVSAHSVIADMGKVPEDVIDALRDDNPIADEKLEALRKFTLAVVDKQGWLAEADLDAFFDAGYGRQQVLEVLVGVAMKTMSNYVNHIAGTELDEAFAARRWEAPGEQAA